ncbi:FAD-linked oxidase-like protein [Crepidotus variabilis]|uniref:D-lactate dehydrogenase (cytochrome) n=1 Tax=Crepidotus variabilis TaxID=179855 RepID=A0A9P6ENW7_9AGAR|nr:FAD-linked oxidase-like protein [Crepidotus variabilis]
MFRTICRFRATEARLSQTLKNPVRSSCRYFRTSHLAMSGGFSQYSPWSNKFQGSTSTKALLQALVYSTILLGGTTFLLNSTSVVHGSKEVPCTLASTYGTKQELAAAIEKLRAAFSEPDAVSTEASALLTYGSSENSYHPSSPHSVIVRPKSTEDVVKIVNIAREYKIPITPYSGATSLEGHFNGYSTGSICVDLSGMDKIININVDDADLTCQSGARWEDINIALRSKGIPLFFPLDPGPGATIGGMVGTGCSGTNAVRYGTARAEWFLNLTVVLPNGEVIKTRRRARKSAAGFDTTKLFIGAEGTLGIVTEATLRLTPKLPTKVAMAQFENVGKAVTAVQEILRSPQGVHLQCIELLDDNMMSAINSAGLIDKPYPVKDTLFFKIQGDDVTVKQTSQVIQEIVKKHESLRFQFAGTDQEAEDLWQNRKYALMSSLAAYPGKRCWTTDVCVPVSRLPELVYETKKDLATSNLSNTIVGHVGDGNFHALILFDREKEFEAASGAVHRLVHRAIALDGTCTGEHGVGLGKKEYLVEELGTNTVELMKTIKKAIDPLNIMNPGKLYPDNARDKHSKRH